jgi:transposase
MRPYSNDLRDRVVGAMEGGMSCREAGAQFGIAPSMAGNWHRLFRRTKSYTRWRLEETVVGSWRKRLAGLPRDWRRFLI